MKQPSICYVQRNLGIFTKLCKKIFVVVIAATVCVGHPANGFCPPHGFPQPSVNISKAPANSAN